MKEIEKFEDLTQMEQEAAMGVAKYMMGHIIRQQGFPEGDERVNAMAFTQATVPTAAFPHGARVDFTFAEADEDPGSLMLGIGGVTVYESEAEFDAAIAEQEAAGHQGRVSGVELADRPILPFFGPVGEA